MYAQLSEITVILGGKKQTKKTKQQNGNSPVLLFTQIKLTLFGLLTAYRHYITIPVAVQ